jgi:hypothetical protein
MDGERVDESTRLQWQRVSLKLKRPSRDRKLINPEVLVHEWKTFEIDQSQYWGLLSFELDPDDPTSKIKFDRSHHKEHGEVIMEKIAPIGFKYTERVRIGS